MHWKGLIRRKANQPTNIQGYQIYSSGIKLLALVLVLDINDKNKYRNTPEILLKEIQKEMDKNRF